MSGLTHHYIFVKRLIMKLSPHITLACYLALLSFSVGYSQSVGINTQTPDSSAALEIKSTSQGLLIPRMNTMQRTGIDDPAEGLLVFDSQEGTFWYFQDSSWEELRAGVFKNENGVVRNTGDHASEDFVFGAANLPPTVQALDTLFFFDKSRGAFRVGSADSASWKTDSLGWSSFAAGRNTKAIGRYSSAFGINTKATGTASSAFGSQTSATDFAAVAFGSGTKAQGSYSVAFGQNTEAIGSRSTALGNSSLASGSSSFAAGSDTEAIGINSTAIGFRSKANGNYSTAMGYRSIANGSQSVAMGFDSEANGLYSFATGFRTVAQGTASVSIGRQTEAIGNYSLAISRNTDAIGDYSIASGYYTEAIGDRSVSLGHYTKAGSYASLALGKFNVGLGNDSTWVATEPVFEIGNGTSDGARANALTVLKNGKTGIGTHLPDQLLDVRGTSQIKLNSSISSPHLILHEESTTDFARLKFNNSNAETSWTIAGRPKSDTTSSQLHFYLEGVGNIMSVHGSDRVGIRKTSPESALHINAKPNDNGLRVQLNNNTRFLVLKNGGISMGANNNDVTNSDVYIANQLYFSGINNLPTHRIHLPNDSDDADGKGLAYEWAVYSDGRVKKNVEPLAYGLADVLALNPVSYNHHSSQFNTNGLQLTNEFESEIGFIAQEVHQVIAEAVNQPTNENEALWSMDYERLVPVLVKAIQELASDNDALLGQLERQTAMNRRYEMRLTQIESIMAQLIEQGDSESSNTSMK
ncbi:MAG: hypothetical protein DRI69_03020 [Bacteroidetes bacterium]|nr:MAG: hypothetical protein DRI69_03020 [Bacteroidota bacterium]